MRELTNIEVIKAIPFDPVFKQKLLSNYQKYNEGQQYEIARLCWKAFHQMRRLLTDWKNEEFLREVAEGKKTITPTFNQEVAEAVWQDIENMISGKMQEQQKIEAIRLHLQDIISSQKLTVND
ncbi:hypothetical protein A3F03_00510 [Candidatus Roizmanbacteria bacterium RIFCSPHIGHO2_12_FULL_41_11]|uniref:Uncharacterized protein n=2 Tax=Candidatus Roizmaniibacteriota TaxID=1752723 RepID=A0A1F7J7T4_9BACT|nr:MAG: hypothetical protein A3F03_00510 [Candidatus Roizmanbacteria bacterium RIFCSPHIGHO2_12_FULL_41_11]OGK51678.1 MAG: hypothetical protein A2966_05070 [Candidatus Roizmanbacteria bacterium RIFCSPLOWO2_01_FULL_41_22]